MIHQALFSLKIKVTKKCRLLQFCLTLKGLISSWQKNRRSTRHAMGSSNKKLQSLKQDWV